MAVASGDFAPGDKARLIDVQDDGFELVRVGESATFKAGAPCGAIETSRRHSQQKMTVCPTGEPDQYLVRIETRNLRSMDVSIDSVDFTAHVLPDGCLSVGRLGATWSVEIPQSEQGEALRKHPDLLGAAVALGYLPLVRENNVALIGVQ